MNGYDLAWYGSIYFITGWVMGWLTGFIRSALT